MKGGGGSISCSYAVHRRDSIYASYYARFQRSFAAMAPTECVAEPGLATRSRARFENHLEQLPFYLAYGSAVSIVFSIAVSQILLVLGIAALLISREKARFPPIKLPFALFFVATVLADLFSGNPRAGMPQIRKFF